jgi:hypothetical protein
MRAQRIVVFDFLVPSKIEESITVNKINIIIADNNNNNKQQPLSLPFLQSRY